MNHRQTIEPQSLLRGDRATEPEDARITRRELLAGGGAIGTTALAGCSSILASPSRSLRLGTLYPPITLDPIVLHDLGSAQVASKIFDGLFTYDNTASITPQIAAGKPTVSDGGRTYEVTIRNGATFQNGQPVTPADVIYSFEAPRRENTANAGDVSMIDAIRAVDGRTVRFELQYPYPAFEHTLTRAIVPKSVRENSESFAEKPVGAGPFELQSFAPGSDAHLSRWKNYWDDSPNITDFTVSHVESPVVRMTSLVTGRNDMVEPVPSQLWTQFQQRSHISVAARNSFTSYFVAFNINEGPTTKRQVREAIDYCLDMDEAVRQFVGRAGQRQYSPLPPSVANQWNMPIEKWRAISHSKNVDQAKQLFEQAGVSNWKPEILVSKDPTLHAIAISLAKGIRSAGFPQAAVTSVSKEQFLNESVSGVPDTYNMYIGSHAGTPDPDSFMYTLFHENQEGETNGTFYQNERVMTQIQDARETTNRTKRRDLYVSAITTLLEDRVHLPGFSRRVSFGLKDRIRGFRAHSIPAVNPRLVGRHPVSVKSDTQ